MIVRHAVHNTIVETEGDWSSLHKYLIEQLKEFRIDRRRWYATAVHELSYQDEPTPERIDLLRRICLKGYADLTMLASCEGLTRLTGLNFERDSEYRPLYDEFMDFWRIKNEFKNCDRTFPKDAVLRARQHKERIVPSLIEAISNKTAYARFGVPNRDGTVQFAVHLLAEFQAKEALPAIFDSLSLSIDEIWDYLYADGYFESMPGILNRLIGDDPELYDQKLRDPETPVALQCCLSRSLKYLVARKIVSEVTYADWLRDYLEIAIQAEKKDIVTDLVCDIVLCGKPRLSADCSKCVRKRACRRRSDSAGRGRGRFQVPESVDCTNASRPERRLFVYHRRIKLLGMVSRFSTVRKTEARAADGHRRFARSTGRRVAFVVKTFFSKHSQRQCPGNIPQRKPPHWP